jgi:hypothetical protein
MYELGSTPFHSGIALAQDSASAGAFTPDAVASPARSPLKHEASTTTVVDFASMSLVAPSTASHVASRWLAPSAGGAAAAAAVPRTVWRVPVHEPLLPEVDLPPPRRPTGIAAVGGANLSTTFGALDVPGVPTIARESYSF